MQTCKRCKQPKADHLFGRNDRICKACWATYKKEKYRNDPNVKLQAKARRATPEGRATDIWNNAKTRSRTYKLDFDLTVEQILAALKFGVCRRTGLPFDLSGAEDTRYHPMAPSLDRIDKEKGYVSDNVQVVCNWYNIAKNEFTENQMLAFCRAVVAVADQKKD